jgi:hypothetical protein
MKPKQLLTSGFVLFALAAGSIASGQVVLSGTNHTQDFNSLGNGLPPGWSVRTNATATSLGTAAAFNPNAITWGTQAGQFGNCAGTVANAGTNFNGDETTTVQGNCTNRSLAIRQTAAFGDPGAAFVFQIANTIGLSNFTFSVDLNMLKVNANSNVWTVDYAVGNSPSAFTSLGTYTDPGVFGSTRRSFALGADADNQTASIWIRIGALTASANTSTRDTFGLDNFSLSYAGSAVTEIPLFIQSDGQNAVLTWNDTSFALQAAPTSVGTFTNVPAATSPFTNALDEPAKYFRLIH